ncbi:MAG: hydroxymethylglutaryl-CoA reductase, degradative [Anaerolineae bacterium]
MLCTGRTRVAPSSRLPGFYNLPPDERLRQVAAFAGLDAADLAALAGTEGLDVAKGDRMVENVVGVHALPLGIATNVVINGRDVLVPMAVEEPSVIAGLSYAARLVRDGGGFSATSDAPHMIGQIQVLDLPDPGVARLRLLAAKADLIALANTQDPVIVKLGGGARDVEVRHIPESAVGPMLVLHLIYDTRDAMGANAVNTALEAISPLVARVSGGRVGLRILSNLADRRLARAYGRVPKESLAMGGLTPEQGVTRILEAHAFAEADPYRAVTHNKGIMNGVDAVVLATGNDWRAIEAGAHAYAARSGRYRPLSAWERDAQGDLVGSIELPVAAGTVGGATRVHPTARVALKILGVSGAGELAQVIATVGLAQNLAALRALAMEGIQRGHMQLHARQVATAAGAPPELVEAVAQRMAAEGAVRLDRATVILQELRDTNHEAH